MRAMTDWAVGAVRPNSVSSESSSWCAGVMGPVRVLILRGSDAERKSQAGSPCLRPSPVFAPSSNLMPIDDEAGAFGHFVVEMHGGGVGLMGLPVDARRSRQSCPVIDSLNQSAAHALAACCLGR